MRIRTAISALLAAFTLASCISDDREKLPEGEVSIQIGAQPQGLSTKSAYLPGEQAADAISNFNVFVFDGNGVLVQEKYSVNGSAVEVSLQKDSRYGVKVVTNMGDILSRINSLSDLEGYTHSVTASGISSNGIPMYGSEDITVNSSSVSIPVRRLFARYEFKLDASGVTGGTLRLTALQVRNSADRVSPVKAFKAAAGQTVTGGDSATQADVNAVNAGSGMYFYVPENMQGDEPGLNDAAKKLPKGESGAYNYSIVDTDNCTYIEAQCVYNNGTETPVTYRMMLGENSTSSFNIARNTKYSVTLKPVGNPLSDDWWKCDPDVTPKTLSYIEMTSSPQNVEVGQTATFGAIAHWSDASSTAITSDPGTTWSIDNSSVAQLTAKGQFKALAAGTAKVTVSYGGMSANGVINVTAAPVTEYLVEVSPSSKTMTVGESFDFSAKYVTLVNGVRTNEETVTASAVWESGNAGVASAHPSVKGRFSAVAPGTAKISATHEGKKGEATITVTAPDPVLTYELVMTAPLTRDILVGATTDFSVKYITYSDGVKTDEQDVTGSAAWTSDNEAVAETHTTIKGRFTAKAAGTAHVTASYNGKTATGTINVSNPAPVVTYSLKVTTGTQNEGSTASVMVGGSQQFKAWLVKTTDGVPSYEDKTSTAGWSSSNTTVASVSAGLAHGNAVGTSTISASMTAPDGTTVSGSGTLSVTAVPVTTTYELTITPASASINVGGSADFTVKRITKENGVAVGTPDDVTSSVSWSIASGSSHIESVTGVFGRYRGTSAGNATVSAYDSVSGQTVSATITVSDVVSHSLVVTPSSKTIKVGETASFTARYYTTTNGSTDSGEDVTTAASWTILTPSVASGSNGSFVGTAAGTTTITVNYGGETKGVVLTVTEPVVTYELDVKAVTPSNATIEVGQQAIFSATLYTVTDGVRDSGTPCSGSVAWTSSNPSVATSAGNGYYNGTAPGTVTVTATDSAHSVSGTATLTVVAPAPVVTHSLVVTPSSQTKDIGENAAFMAMYYTYHDGVQQGDPSNVTSGASWSSSNTTVASLQGTGVFKALAAGTATVSASYLGESGSATFNVNPPAPVVTYSLVITPSSQTKEIGQNALFIATLYTYHDGVLNGTADVTMSPYTTWGGGSSSIAFSQGQGSYYCVAAGTVVVTASYKNPTMESAAVAEDATLTVNPPAPVITHSLEVTPASQTKTVGQTATYQARWYTITDGVKDAGTDVTSSASWSSGNTTVASSQGAGVFNALAVGTAGISAVYSGETGSASLTVEAAPDVTEYRVRITNLPQEVSYLSSTTFYAVREKRVNGGAWTDDGNVSTQVSWSSSNPSVATFKEVNTGGVFDAKGIGTTTITASLSGCEDGTGVLTVVDNSNLVFTTTMSSLSPGPETVTVIKVRNDGTGLNVPTKVTGSYRHAEGYSVSTVNTNIPSLAPGAEMELFGVKFYKGGWVDVTIEGSGATYKVNEHYLTTPSAVTARVVPGGSTSSIVLDNPNGYTVVATYTVVYKPSATAPDSTKQTLTGSENIVGNSSATIGSSLPSACVIVSQDIQTEWK